MPKHEARDVVMILPECHPPPWGGTQKQALLLADRLRSQGVAVKVASKRAGIFHDNGRISPSELAGMGLDANLPLVYFPSLRRFPGWSLLIGFVLWTAWRRKGFRIIHAHTAATGVIACLAAWGAKKKVVVKFPSMKNVDYLLGNGWARRLRRRVLVKRCDRFIAMNGEMKAALRSAGIPEEKIALIPNGVELNGGGGRPEREAAKAELSDGDNPRVVLFAGRLIEEKGLDRLLEVWRRLPSRDKNVLWIVGDGPLRAELEATAAAFGISSSVRFFGHRLDVDRFYLAADLFVMPSRTEGMSNALLEAMAAGLPVVASNVGGNREAVDDGRSGFLIEWDEPVPCAAVLSVLLDNPVLRHSMSRAARERVRAFAMTEVSERYRRLYDSLLTERDLP